MKSKLTIISGPHRGKSFSLDEEEIYIGRDKTNQISLQDVSVSRRHCLIENIEDRFYVSDLQSLNGTFVNSLAAQKTLLQHGDRIIVGDFEFIFQTGGEEEISLSSLVNLDKTEFHLPKNSVLLRLDEAVGEMARDLTALLKITSKINSIYNVEELQLELLKEIFEIVPATEGAILLVDNDLEFTEIVGLNRKGESEAVNVSQTVVQEVLAKKSLILINDLPNDENLAKSESLLLSGSLSLLCVPVVLFEKTLGAMYLSTDLPNLSFDSSHLRIVAAIAGIASVAIENARNFTYLKNENARLRTEVLPEHKMIGESEPMQKVFQMIAKSAPTDATILINGESGTGKELAARAIHLNSLRKNAPFVAINCAALTETLLESELFGHEKGSFTGAIQQKKGKIEIADGGSLFLDEIGEMALSLQAKLLRVLQEREFERVGGIKPIKVNIRLIAATNKDLEVEIRTGNFRQDLFFRLNVVQFTMPALRERKVDILPLAENFLNKFSRKMNRPVRGISAKAKKLLQNYDFPGNVRELENAIERAVVLGAGEWILPEDLPENFLDKTAVASEEFSALNYHQAMRNTKKELIRKAFLEANGNYTKMAEILDVHPNYVHRLINNLDMKGELGEK